MILQLNQSTSRGGIGTPKPLSWSWGETNDSIVLKPDPTQRTVIVTVDDSGLLQWWAQE